MTATDIESLQPRAGRSLQACLVTSVITLFVLLIGVTVTATLFIRQIQTELATISKDPLEHIPGSEAYRSEKYKMQNFAYLRANSDQLKNETMTWAASSSGSVGSRYLYNDKQQALQPQLEGSYLLYLDLELRCVRSDLRKCGEAHVTVKVMMNMQSSTLDCEAQLPRGKKDVRAAKCWKVVQLGPTDRLITSMEAHGDTQSWKLNTNQSGLGMFLVDGQAQ
ncbi:hypothetical protein JZ751_027507 [Albula glossodonta]|uniref:TNF family profile domain-containing protein n=1 Tax=Albula glossodonta TaxID=121402 RepID=A0A8T2NDF2_9TELE|nr:hypothetical protein JZ751_027507 [Albula glossodonta]